MEAEVKDSGNAGRVLIVFMCAWSCMPPSGVFYSFEISGLYYRANWVLEIADGLNKSVFAAWRKVQENWSVDIHGLIQMQIFMTCEYPRIDRLQPDSHETVSLVLA